MAQNRIGDKHKLTLMMLVGVLIEVTATAILRVDILDVCVYYQSYTSSKDIEISLVGITSKGISRPSTLQLSNSLL